MSVHDPAPSPTSTPASPDTDVRRLQVMVCLVYGSALLGALLLAAQAL